MTHVRNSRAERGAILALLALMLPVLIGILGLVIDSGHIYTEKRHMQPAADAAAIAAAMEIRDENYGGYVAGAKRDAALNGYKASTDVDIEVNRPPTRGPRKGSSEYVEVIIREQTPLLLMRAFGKDKSTVEARAVAGLVPQNACIYALNPTASKTLWVNGTADVTIDKCGIIVNSESSTAAVSDGTATVNAASIGVVGYYSGSGFTPSPETGVSHVTDPLASLDAPTFGACTYTGQLQITGSVTLDPGVYCGGIKVVSGGTVHMNPGTYVMYGGGLDVMGGAELDGSEVMIYNTGGAGYTYDSIDFAGSAEIHLSAPTSGTYKGILIFQDRALGSSKTNNLAGTADSTFEGVIYAPGSALSWTGADGSVAQHVVIIADKVQFSGTSNVTALDPLSGMLPPAFSVARLME